MDGAGFITQIQPHRFDQHLPASLLGTLSCHPSLYTAISQNIKKGLTGEVNRIDHLVTMRCSPGENRWCWHSRGGHLICNAFSKHCWSPSAPHTHTHTHTHTHMHSNSTPIYWPLQQDLTPHYSGMVWGSWQTALTGPPVSPDPNQIHRSHRVSRHQTPQDAPEANPAYDLSRLRHRTAGGALRCQAIATPWAHVRSCCNVLMRRVTAIRDCHCHEEVLLTNCVLMGGACQLCGPSGFPEEHFTEGEFLSFF